jgi:shikimate kinase
MDRAWILVGMMGAGKTSVGRLLAEATGREHVDTDHLLQHRLGRPIPLLFKIYGESTFREHETSILRGLEPSNYVISTGGGIVLKEANWTEMHRLGTVIYLKASIEDLLERLEASQKKRPLLQTEDWQERLVSILDQRRPLYEQADVTVDITGFTAQEAAGAVQSALSGAL